MTHRDNILRAFRRQQPTSVGFDFVFSQFVLEYLPDPASAREMVRTTRQVGSSR